MKIAILGNGQLARMLNESITTIDIQVDIYPLPKINKDGSSSWEDISNWKRKLKGYDVVTYEIENIAVNLLKEIEKDIPVFPPIKAIEVSQDRFVEKTEFSKLDIKTNDYMKISSYNELTTASEKFNFPFIIKTRRFGYDGKGQFIIHQKSDMLKAWNQLGNYELIAESYVNFDFEVSQIACRDKNGNIVYYPLVRNEHKEGILRETHVLNFDKHLVDQAQGYIKKLLCYFNYVGTLSVEFFVLNDELLINEIAPRVHNSGHWSINGAKTSQFKNHMLSISGFELGKTDRQSLHITMVNLIGEDITDDRYKKHSNIFSKSYKKDVRPGRKMGHINILSDNLHQHNKLIDSVYDGLVANRILNKLDK